MDARPWRAANEWLKSGGLGLLALASAEGAWAKEEGYLTGEILTQIQDTLGVPVLLAFAMSIALFFVLNRTLRAEIARRVKVEVESEVERARLNAILNKAGVGVMLVDRHHRLIDVNYRWCVMFDYRRREARGRLSVSSVYLADDLESVGHHFHALFSGRVRTQAQAYRLQRKDGSAFWGLVSTSTVDEVGHERKWVVAMITDIDAQKRSEHALRESEERLRFITENTLDAVWQLDAEGRVAWVNGADERMRGFRRAEVIGLPFRELISPDGHAAYDRAMQYEMADVVGYVIRLEIGMLCQGGTSIWAEANFRPIRGSNGETTGYIGVTRDASHHRATHEKLREQTIRDPLTGLFNRRFLDESLERELLRAKRDNVPLALMMIDVDHFKKLNDKHGHPAGDEVLRRLGALISKGARGADLPCRYGGEEFLLVLPNMPIEAAAERAEAWRHGIERETMTYGEDAMSVTVSIGVAAFPCDGDTREALVKSADEALYVAKRSGRNRVVATSRFPEINS